MTNANDETAEIEADIKSDIESGIEAGIEKVKNHIASAKQLASDNYQSIIAPHIAAAREKATADLIVAQEKAAANLKVAHEKAVENLAIAKQKANTVSTAARENASSLKAHVAAEAHQAKQTQMMHHYGAHFYTHQRTGMGQGAFGLAPLNPGERRVVVITGASAGMGYEAARLFARHGWLVFAGARRVEKIPHSENIVALKLDVTSSRSNHAFIKAALDSELNVGRRIDVLINNAGYGEYGPVEEVSMPKIRKQFETNFFGAVELAQLVLPTMREQHSGRILNISSVAGNVYLPLGAYYDATKAAMQQWSDVLDLEVMPFGVRSVVVQPGNTQSEWVGVMLENALTNLRPESPYSPLVKSLTASMDAMKGYATSEDLARVFYKAATSANVGLRYFYSLGDRAMARFARVHPLLFKAGVIYMMKQAKK
jgi:NAD(P)-dependent dehydrogenase (short-subunit alcohol dehydrogenase family)